MNTLEKVKIEKTFRIKKPSVIAVGETVEQAVARTALSLDKDQIAVPCVSDSTCILNHVNGRVYKVAYADKVSESTFRVEVSDFIVLDLHEFLYLTEGDEGVNKVGFYIEKDSNPEQFISTDELNEKRSRFAERSLDINDFYTKVTMYHGAFMTID